MATGDFDPYEQWLGISRHERPIDLYRLLGLQQFESDAARIQAAAEERMAYIRQFQTGPRGLHTQKLLNEFAAAKLRLLNPDTKAEYDERLRRSVKAAEEFAVAEEVALPEPVLPDAAAESVPSSYSSPTFAPRPIQIRAVERRTVPAAKPPSKIAQWATILIGVVVVAGLVMGVGSWYRDRNRDVRQSNPDENLIGMRKTGPVPIPEGYIAQSSSGAVQLAARDATLQGSTVALVDEGETGVIADWTAQDDYVTWNFFLRKGHVFRLKVTYAVDGDPAGARWRVMCDGQVKSWDVRASGGLNSFVTDEQELIHIQQPGKYQLELHVDDKPADVVLSVRSVELVPRRR